MRTSRNLSITQNEFGEGSAGNVEVVKSFKYEDIRLTFELQMASTSKSRGNLRATLEAEWQAFLDDTLGLTSDSSSKETTGLPKSTSPSTQTGPENWE